MNQLRPVGDQLRDWRQRRRLSQLDLALDADISTRHLSFVETGRSTPSRDLLLHLADQLEVPLRDRNAMLLAAGYAPAYTERPLDDPALGPARAAIDLLLKAHEPFPALAVDRRWNLVAANGSVGPFLEGAAPELLVPPMNVLRLSLHPQGLAPRILNFGEWRIHILDRLRQQIAATGDSALEELHAELCGYPGPAVAAPHDYGGVVVPLRLRTSRGDLSFFGMVTVFGTPVDITLSELAIEAFFPADEATAKLLRGER